LEEDEEDEGLVKDRIQEELAKRNKTLKSGWRLDGSHWIW